jgi:copper homeostasis protein
VDGIVFGMLTEDGKIDMKRCKEIIAKARPLKITCHRAFDMTRDPFEALEDCIDVGFDRILTSGHKSTALEGIDLIQQLVLKANGRISIMAGSGINENSVSQVVNKSGVKEIHFSAVTPLPSRMSFQNEHISKMGNKSGSEYLIRSVDPQQVKVIRSLAERAE